MSKTMAEKLFNKFNQVFQGEADPKELGGLEECQKKGAWFKSQDTMVKGLYQYASKKDEIAELDSYEIKQNFRRKTMGAYTNTLAQRIAEELNIIVVNGV